MRDTAEGWKQGRKPAQPEKEAWLTAADIAQLIGVTAKSVRMNCIAGLYPGARKASMNGGEGWQIPLNVLPASAQIAWHESQRKKCAEAKPRRTAVRDTVSSIETVAPNDQAYKDVLWEAFSRATENHRQEAARRAEIVIEYNRLAGAGMPQGEILAALLDRFDKGITRATLWRYRKMVKGQDPSLWAPLLLPEWKGKTHRAEFSEEAWEYIKEKYLIQSQPSLRLVYDLAREVAPENGWVIPSYDTVQARLNELPHDYVVFRREGNKALGRVYAHQMRDYSVLELHELWNTDGHKANVFVRPKEGEEFRPIVVAFQEVRSRKFLGWAVGKSETSDLVRRALHHSIVACGNVIPGRVLMDNGMAFAAKENTGGARHRNRFKVKENELPGTLTLLGIEPVWATPGHGQAKPIERAWQTFTEMAKLFDGAYCGKDAKSKPENFNVKNAVPLDEFLRVLEKMFNYHNARAHRGNSMRGKSPNQLYDSLMAATVVRQATDAQLRFCLLAAESVRLDRENGSFEVLKNRYWNEACSGLARTSGYSVRYDPSNPAAPVYLFLNERFLFEVPLLEKTGFNDREAAKEHGRRKRAYMNSVKQLERDREKLWEAESQDFNSSNETTPAAPASSRPKIVKPIRLPLVLPPPSSAAEEEETPLMSAVEFTELLAEKLGQKGR